MIVEDAALNDPQFHHSWAFSIIFGGFMDLWIFHLKKIHINHDEPLLVTWLVNVGEQRWHIPKICASQLVIPSSHQLPPVIAIAIATTVPLSPDPAWIHCAAERLPDAAKRIIGHHGKPSTVTVMSEPMVRVDG